MQDTPQLVEMCMQSAAEKACADAPMLTQRFLAARCFSSHVFFIWETSDCIACARSTCVGVQRESNVTVTSTCPMALSVASVTRVCLLPAPWRRRRSQGWRVTRQCAGGRFRAFSAESWRPPAATAPPRCNGRAPASERQDFRRGRSQAASDERGWVLPRAWNNVATLFMEVAYSWWLTP